MPVRTSPERRSRRTRGQSPEVAQCLEDVLGALRGRRRKNSLRVVMVRLLRLRLLLLRSN